MNLEMKICLNRIEARQKRMEKYLIKLHSIANPWTVVAEDHTVAPPREIWDRQHGSPEKVLAHDDVLGGFDGHY